MTRFQQEISGMLGGAWVRTARAELDRIQDEFNKGKIKVDENGVLRNSIGRVAVPEVCEKCDYLGIYFDKMITELAREKETEASLEKYRESQKNKEISQEELFEMRANFGAGTTVVDVITGEKIIL